MTESSNTKKELIKMDKSWKWLIYFDILFPLVLFLLAALLPSGGLKHQFSLYFHTYNLYIINVIPNFAALTGVLGILIHAVAIIYGIIKKDILDIIISIVFSSLITVYFLYSINYLLIPFLEFA